MADEKAPPRKQGLHGWKAAGAIFGCGSLAAFGIFGALMGVLSLFFNTVSSGISGEEQAPPVGQQSIAPRENFLDDKFDLCARTIPSIRELNVTIDDSSSGGFVDTSVDGGSASDNNLVRSDECEGTLIPSSSFVEPWSFQFSYRAVIFSPNDDREEIAEVDLDDWRDQVEGSGLTVSESGRADIGEDSYYYYGSRNESQVAFYTLVARQRSAVFMIKLESTDDTSMEEFAAEARKFAPQIEITLGNRIPE